MREDDEAIGLDGCASNGRGMPSTPSKATIAAIASGSKQAEGSFREVITRRIGEAIVATLIERALQLCGILRRYCGSYASVDAT